MEGTSSMTANLEATRLRRADAVLHQIARLLSPLSRPMAGRRFFPMWAVLRHRGRRSGHEYSIPVAVRVTADGVFIALPFGERTQWARNVIAARGCTLRWRARDFAMTSPRVIGTDEAANAFHPIQRWILRTAGVKRFIRLRPAVDASTGPGQPRPP
jgi:deazaflavin-dependent oxidoreductase (nitroreductase family)